MPGTYRSSRYLSGIAVYHSTAPFWCNNAGSTGLARCTPIFFAASPHGRCLVSADGAPLCDPAQCGPVRVWLVYVAV